MTANIRWNLWKNHIQLALSLKISLIHRTNQVSNYAITPVILDDGLAERGVFLDIFKAFDKVWLKAFVLKLIQIGISGDLLTILSCSLNDGKKRIVLNTRTSSWWKVFVAVSQGSIPCWMLFFVYINDLCDGLLLVQSCLLMIVLYFLSHPIWMLLQIY